MKILALEFSSPRRSVAVLNSETGQAAEMVDTGDGHAVKPFALIESVLQQTGLEREQIEVIAVGLGPGSYTGVRAAIALAQGWRLAHGVKLCGINSADCLATQAAAERLSGRFGVVIDAQRGELYFAEYEMADSLRALSALQILPREKIETYARAGTAMIGPQVNRWFPSGREVFPLAATLAQMASVVTDFVSSESLEPIYLRETAFVKAASTRILHG